MVAFGRNVLGKGVVGAKDTPTFIANRFAIASSTASSTLEHVTRHEVTTSPDR